MADNKSTEVIDISRYIRRMYLIWFVISFLLFIATDYILELDKNVGFIILGLIVPGVLYGVDYFITKDKVVLNLGNILASKHKEYLLTNGMKSIDNLRIRNELNYDEDQDRDAFAEFLVKNELNKYDKIYLTVSNSQDDIEFVSNIINTNCKDAS